MKIQASFQKSLSSIVYSLPLIVGILALVNLISLSLEDIYPRIFTGNLLLDPLIGALAGSASFGIPITSYIVGGELIKQGVSLLAVTAFIMAWTTVGLAMLPLEVTHLGKQFAIKRNLLNFIFSLLIAILTILTLKIL
jgi:hypothetical protein